MQVPHFSAAQIVHIGEHPATAKDQATVHNYFEEYPHQALFFQMPPNPLGLGFVALSGKERDRYEPVEQRWKKLNVQIYDLIETKIRPAFPDVAGKLISYLIDVEDYRPTRMKAQQELMLEAASKYEKSTETAFTIPAPENRSFFFFA